MLWSTKSADDLQVPLLVDLPVPLEILEVDG